MPKAKAVNRKSNEVSRNNEQFILLQLRKALDQTTAFTKSSPEKNQKEQEIVKGNPEEEVKKRDKKDDKKQQLEEKATSSASKQIEELGKDEANDDEGTE